jgi:hypothetical protein
MNITSLDKEQFEVKLNKTIPYVPIPVDTHQSKEFILKDFLNYLSTLKSIEDIDKRLLKKLSFEVIENCYSSDLPVFIEKIKALYVDCLKDNETKREWFVKEKQKSIQKEYDKEQDRIRMDTEQAEVIERTKFIECTRCHKPTPENDEVKEGIRFCLSCSMTRSDMLKTIHKTFDSVMVDNLFKEHINTWEKNSVHSIDSKQLLHNVLLDRTTYPNVYSLIKVLKDHEPTLLFKEVDNCLLIKK